MNLKHYTVPLPIAERVMEYWLIANRGRSVGLCRPRMVAKNRLCKREIDRNKRKALIIRKTAAWSSSALFRENACRKIVCGNVRTA